MSDSCWKGKRVLVTGAGGFIGSHLAERLAVQGAQVRAMVHYNALGRKGWLDHADAAPQMEIVPGDICDRESVCHLVRDQEVVFHLAALIAIPYSYQAPHSYLRTNIEGTLNILQAARECRTPRIITTSTSEVYGTARYAPIDEDHPLQGQSPYSASKIGADKISEAFHLSFGLPVTTVRPFNTFGPRQSLRAVIPTIITQCLRGEAHIKLGNLAPTRDMNYVANTVDAFLLAAQSDQAVGRTVHFGSGREISIGDLAALIARLCGKEVDILGQSDRMRPEGSEVERLIADNRKAREWLDWQPRFSLEDGLQQTIAWFSEHMDFYRDSHYVV